MKLKTAVTLENISWWVTLVARLPFIIGAKFFNVVSNIINNFQNWIAYKLCRATKEFDLVKNEHLRNSKYFGAKDLEAAIKNKLITGA